MSNDEEKILTAIRRAKCEKKPITLVIHVTGGIVQLMKAEIIAQEQKRDICHIDRRNGYR